MHRGTAQLSPPHHRGTVPPPPPRHRHHRAPAQPRGPTQLRPPPEPRDRHARAHGHDRPDPGVPARRASTRPHGPPRTPARQDPSRPQDHPHRPHRTHPAPPERPGRGQGAPPQFQSRQPGGERARRHTYPAHVRPASRAEATSPAPRTSHPHHPAGNPGPDTAPWEASAQAPIPPGAPPPTWRARPTNGRPSAHPNFATEALPPPQEATIPTPRELRNEPRAPTPARHHPHTAPRAHSTPENAHADARQARNPDEPAGQRDC